MLKTFDRRAEISNRRNTRGCSNIADKCVACCSRLRTPKPSLFDPNAHAVYFSSRTLCTTQCRTWEAHGGRQACSSSVGTTVAGALRAWICSIEHESCSLSADFRSNVQRLRRVFRILSELFLESRTEWGFASRSSLSVTAIL